MDKYTIENNFAEILANLNNIEDLKFVANALCASIKEQYDLRVKQLYPNAVNVKAEVKLTEVGKKTRNAKVKTGPDKKVTVKVETHNEKSVTIPAASKAEQPKVIKVVPLAKKPERKTEEVVQLTAADIEKIRALNITFEPNTETGRSWILRGDTKPIKELIKSQFEGKFFSKIQGAPGWVVRNSMVPEVAKALGFKLETA